MILEQSDVMAIIECVNMVTARIHQVQRDIDNGLFQGHIDCTMGLTEIVNWRDDIRIYNACIETLSTCDLEYLKVEWKSNGRVQTKKQRYPTLSSIMPGVTWDNN